LLSLFFCVIYSVVKNIQLNLPEMSDEKQQNIETEVAKAVQKRELLDPTTAKAIIVCIIASFLSYFLFSFILGNSLGAFIAALLTSIFLFVASIWVNLRESKDVTFPGVSDLFLSLKIDFWNIFFTLIFIYLIQFIIGSVIGFLSTDDISAASYVDILEYLEKSFFYTLLFAVFLSYLLGGYFSAKLAIRKRLPPYRHALSSCFIFTVLSLGFTFIAYFLEGRENCTCSFLTSTEISDGAKALIFLPSVLVSLIGAAIGVKRSKGKANKSPKKTFLLDSPLTKGFTVSACFYFIFYLILSFINGKEFIVFILAPLTTASFLVVARSKELEKLKTFSFRKALKTLLSFRLDNWNIFYSVFFIFSIQFIGGFILSRMDTSNYRPNSYSEMTEHMLNSWFYILITQTCLSYLLGGFFSAKLAVRKKLLPYEHALISCSFFIFLGSALLFIMSLLEGKVTDFLFGKVGISVIEQAVIFSQFVLLPLTGATFVVRKAKVSTAETAKKAKERKKQLKVYEKEKEEALIKARTEVKELETADEKDFPQKRKQPSAKSLRKSHKP